MKRIITLYLLLATNYATGQLNIFAKAGVQNTNIQVTTTRSEQDQYKSKLGWYGGGQIEYITSEGLLVTGGVQLLLIQYEHKQLAMADAIYTNNYRLTFLEIPFSMGYHHEIARKINIVLSGGGYCNIGISGKNKQFVQGFYPSYSEAWLSEKVSFGNDQNYEDEFRKVNWGLQAALSIGFKNRVYVDVGLKHGITNILSQVLDNYENQNFQSLSIGLKYNLACNKNERRGTKTSSSHKKGF